MRGVNVHQLFARKVFAALSIAAFLLLPAFANAAAYYVGEGEDEFAPDIHDAAEAIAHWIPAANIVTGQDDTAAITTDLSAAIAKMLAGDVLIFHYAGHGSPTHDLADPADPDIHVDANTNGCGCPVDIDVTDADLQIGTSADQGGLADWQTGNTNGLRDDDLADILADVPAGATALVILDACFSGLAIHDGSDLGALPIDFIATADQEHCAPGTSKFLPLFIDAFELTDGTFKADANQDGALSENELFDYTSNFTDDANPQFLNRDPHGDLLVAQVPAPATLLLFAFGLVAARITKDGARRHAALRSGLIP